MIDRDPFLLQTMAKLVQLIRVHLDGIDESTFMNGIDYIDATAFRVQHIGEGAHRLSAALKARHPDLPWTAIVGTRNFLAHNYEDISAARLWGIVTERLPLLEAMCRAELGE